MARKTTRNLNLLLSNQKNPLGTTKPGTKLEVVGVTLTGPKSAAARKIGARLCGGTSTCIALTKLE